MDYELAKDLALPSIAIFGLVCLAVGYWAGSIRTFYRLGQFSMGLRDVLNTLRPWAGAQRNHQFRLPRR